MGNEKGKASERVKEAQEAKIGDIYRKKLAEILCKLHENENMNDERFKNTVKFLLDMPKKQLIATYEMWMA